MLSKFDIDALFASLYGHSIFTIFEGEIQLFQAILSHLEAQNYQDQSDEIDQVEHPVLRRLVNILSQKQLVSATTRDTKIKTENSLSNAQQLYKPPAKFTSIIKRNLDDIEMRDCYLRILQLCKSFSISNLMTEAKDFDVMVKFATPVITELLNSNCFV